ncbi:unnamed protein product, partial [Discosporangium mesarthrocarpum]
MAQHSAHTDYVYLLEAISVLLGAQREKKADLLEDPAFTWGPSTTSSGHMQARGGAGCSPGQLTPKARTAFSEIFKRFSRGGIMDINDITYYMETCGVKPQRDVDYVLKGVLAKYGTSHGNRLMEDGFLKYYTDTAQQDPRQA